MSTTDGVTQMLQDARPPTAADNAWAYSTDGSQALSKIQHRITREAAAPNRAPRRKLGLIAAVVGVAAAGSLAFTVLQVREPVTTDVALCNESASTTSNGARIALTDSTPAGALTACEARWAELWPTTPQPAGFAVCTFPASDGNEGGGQVVIPALADQTNNSACTAAGFALIAGAPVNTG